MDGQTDPPTPRFSIRQASHGDQATIKAMIAAAHLNPFGLNWRRFLVAEEEGHVVGIGQVKPHRDGSRELASLAVSRGRQGLGIGSAIVARLLEGEQGPLYLMCDSRLEPYYSRFGFRPLGPAAMPPYFRVIHSVATVLSLAASIIRGDGSQLSIMRRDPPSKVSSLQLEG